MMTKPIPRACSAGRWGPGAEGALRGRAAGVCLLSLVLPLTAGAGEVSLPVSPAAGTRQAFEYVERLEITGPEAKLSVTSNAVVVVTASAEGVVAELHPLPDRSKTRPDDATPGTVSILAGEAGERVEIDLEPLRIELRFAPHAAGLLAVEGLPKRLANEARTVLGQAPPSNPLRSNVTAGYEIGVWSGEEPVVLRGEQRNGKLWVDWTMTGAGTFEVGKKGWELPVAFILPSQEVRPGTTLSAEAGMRYSPLRPGPERDTTLDVTITVSGAEEMTYRRTCQLRPVVLSLADVSPIGLRELSPRSRLGGRSGDWARTATLATLGVQRLPGVRETGIGMWLAQVAVDCVAGAALRGIEDEASRNLVSRIGRLSPELSPPPGFSEGPPRGFRYAGGSAFRVEYFPSAQVTRGGDGTVQSCELSHGWGMGQVALHIAFIWGDLDVPGEGTESTGSGPKRGFRGLGFRVSAPARWRFQCHLSMGFAFVQSDDARPEGSGFYEGVAVSYALSRRFSIEAHYRRYQLSGEYWYPTPAPFDESIDSLGLGLSVHF